jgi:transcriptional regulator with XRE-family HTH domain
MRALGPRWEAGADEEGVKIPADAGYVRARFVSALREARNERKLNVTEMASHLGVGRAFLGELERGETDPTWPVLQRIRERLHWTDFVGTEEEVSLPYNRFADLQNRAARADAHLRRLESTQARLTQVEAKADELDAENDRLRGALRAAIEALEEGS